MGILNSTEAEFSTTFYGFISKKHLEAKVKSGNYGAVYERLDGSLVVCTEVNDMPYPYNFHGDNTPCGLVVKWIRHATYEDVKGLLGEKDGIEDPAIYFKRVEL